MAGLDELLHAARRLTPQRIGLLVEMAEALSRVVATEIQPKSDLMSPAFVEDFTARLIVYHAMHEQKLNKKTFEYMFRGASEAAGRTAVITANQVNPGADVTVNDVAYSLKTEAAAGISARSVHISKLMEARWIRECLNEEDYAREAALRISEHLSSYQRMITLRAADLANGAVKYDLVEIPLELLRLVGNLKAANFTPRTRNGGSSAKIRVDGRLAFTLRLDGSVEKITVAGLRLGLCNRHASWIIDLGR